MVTVTLKFNDEKLKKLGRTVDEMLEPIRKTLAHFHIAEIAQGVFHSESDDGTIVQGVTLKFMLHYSSYLQFLDSWTVEADGVKETCTSPFGTGALPMRFWNIHHQIKKVMKAW